LIGQQQEQECSGEKAMPKPFVTAPDHESRALNVVGEKITVLASGSQTGGYEIPTGRAGR
jgi:hypothetical protein